jgi:hypothetical protein
VKASVVSKTAADIRTDANGNIFFSGAAPPWTSAATKAFFCKPPKTGDSNE